MTAADPITVLHVDDEPQFTKLTANFLERECDRLTVAVATGASEGLDRLAEDDVDCVVSDYDLPGRDGVEFLAAVRERHPDLPFILFTGGGSESLASDALSRGATAYLRKEPGTDQYVRLAHCITDAVRRRR